ncbi:unnamed protein product, partial [Durusdinium trenchii]
NTRVTRHVMPRTPRKPKTKGPSRSSSSRADGRREDDEPPSVISLPCYDDDGVYLGPAIYGTAKTFAAPAARSMRKRLRRGALKGKTEDLDGYPEREDPGPGDDAPVARLGRSSVPKEGLS